MAKQYYDQPITASTDWGGDHSTGGLQVKGSRVQQFIKETLAALGQTLTAAVSRLDALDGEEGAVALLEELINSSVLARFDGFVDGVTANDQSTTVVNGVVYDIDKGYFLGYRKVSGTTTYYKEWPTRANYADSPEHTPYTSKLFYHEGTTYVYDAGAGGLVHTAEALAEELENGDVVPKFATDIESWATRDASVSSSFADGVRTAAGDESIDSSKPARVLSLTAKGDFTATALKTTGFNLLHGAAAVGGGYYFPVPKLTFGTYGTAEENNGVLFTNAQGANLTPAVRFKALADGVPANVNDGSVCTYVDSNGLRFYTTSGPGYIIVSGITLANTCAHIAWSRRYDEFVSPADTDDAGAEISLTAIINAVHSFGSLLVAANSTGVVADGIVFGTSAATWTRRVSRVKPTWSTVNNGDGTYTHTATITDMAEGGIAECGAISLDVTLNVVSYTDENSAATTDYVKFELATPVTGTVSVSPELNIEDWGLEELVDISGQAEVEMQYSQGYPDAVAALLAQRESIEGGIAGNEERLSYAEEVIAQPATGADYYSMPLLMGQPVKLYAAGTPAEALVPSNWIGFADGGFEWTGLPTVIGQEYIDTENGGKYEAVWDNFTQRTLKWLKV